MSKSGTTDKKLDDVAKGVLGKDHQLDQFVCSALFPKFRALASDTVQDKGAELPKNDPKRLNSDYKHDDWKAGASKIAAV